MGNYVISMYGDADLIDTFRDKLLAAYTDTSVVYDESIGDGEIADGGVVAFSPVV